MQQPDGVIRREYVIRILQENGVSVSAKAGYEIGNLILSKGEILEARTIPDEVGRRLLQAISRKFSIPIHLFYS